ncbi:Transcriptional activator of proteases prtT [Fusarium oxysporum f. sp. albedinis]|nr:Transcriptional activator of proteases prtT [Fusarium oxysporum f. sp. albedinis]
MTLACRGAEDNRSYLRLREVHRSLFSAGEFARYALKIWHVSPGVKARSQYCRIWNPRTNCTSGLELFENLGTGGNQLGILKCSDTHGVMMRDVISAFRSWRCSLSK